MTMRVFSDNNFPISSNAVLTQHKFNESQPNVWIFDCIQLKDIIINNVSLIFNFIEFSDKVHGSNTNELLNITKDANQNKIHKGFGIIPISKLFWKQQIKNGQYIQIKRQDDILFRSPINFKIEEKFVNQLDKGGLGKYIDLGLSQTLNLNYSFSL